MAIKKAFITGVTGQDGSYLAELLLSKGYEVHGMMRRCSLFNTQRIDHLQSQQRFIRHYGELSDSCSINRLITEIQPDEVYNLGAQSHVGVSFQTPETTGDIDGLGSLRILEAVRLGSPKSKVYQASTSEIFGGLPSTAPQSEITPFTPRSPYGAAKLYAYWMCRTYRDAYEMFVCNGILFNHESPRRGENFVTKKITKAAARIKLGLQDELLLGNLDAIRDWGYAKDYVESMWLMLQQREADDYVISTGQAYTVREFCSMAFEEVGLPLTWVGVGSQEVGKDRIGRTLVSVDHRYDRPSEVDLLVGDSSKAERKLGWKSKTSIRELVKIMVDHDYKEASNGKNERM